MYKLTTSTLITRLSDGATIPADPANTDYAAYLLWLADGNTPEPADVPPPKSIAEMWTAIKAERDHRTETLGYMAAGKRFHSDQKSRTQQLGLVMMGAGIPAGLQWKTLDSGFVTMTPTLAQKILGAAAASDTAIFAAAEAHRVAMEASEDPAAYDFTAGWP